MNSRVDREKQEIDKLIEEVRQVAYRLHVYLGNGLLEKVYENGLRHRLEMYGYKVEAQKPLKVIDEDGFILGEYFADLVVNDSLIIEIKACKAITNEHLAQLLNYLTITRQTPYPHSFSRFFRSQRLKKVHPLCKQTLM